MPQCDNTNFTKLNILFVSSSNKQQQLDSILNLIVHYLPYLKISKSVLVLPADFFIFQSLFFISSSLLNFFLVTAILIPCFFGTQSITQQQ